MYLIEKSEDFLLERNDILSYVYRKTCSINITTDLFNKIESKILLLKITPEMFRKRESWFRIIPLNSYSILYKVFLDEKIVRIYSIVYSSSNYQEYI